MKRGGRGKERREDSHRTIVCLLPPVFLPLNFDWIFLTVVISSKSLKRATPRGRI